MARIKAKNLDVEKKLDKKNLKNVRGGWGRSRYWCADGDAGEDAAPTTGPKTWRKKPPLPVNLLPPSNTTSGPRGVKKGKRAGRGYAHWINLHKRE